MRENLKPGIQSIFEVSDFRWLRPPETLRPLRIDEDGGIAMMDMNHIQLNTANIEAAAKFYGHFFDFKTQKKHGNVSAIFLITQLVREI